MKHRAKSADALYILGDLFEYWLGDDDPDPEKRNIVRSIRGVADAGVPTFVMRGNRDFMMGTRFERDTGAKILTDPCVITVGNKKIVVSHGDLLCTDDHQYQQYRARMNKPWMLWLLRTSPLWFRSWLATRGRRRSKEVSAAKPEFLMDVNQDTVEQTLDQFGVDLMIHGHTHRPNVHHFSNDKGQSQTRIVLGDWYEQGSLLRFEPDGSFELEQLTRAEAV